MSQGKTDTVDVTYMWNLKKKKYQQNKTEARIDIKNKLMVVKGEGCIGIQKII